MIHHQNYIHQNLSPLLLEAQSHEDFIIRKFHLNHKQNNDYLQKLTESFNDQKDRTRSEFTSNAKYLAYLFNYQPQYYGIVNKFKTAYLAKIFNDKSPKLLQIAGKLLQDQNQQLLDIIQNLITRNRIDQQKLSLNAYFTTLEANLKWQMQKRQLILKDNHKDLTNFIVKALSFISKNTENTMITLYKMRLLSLIYDYSAQNKKNQDKYGEQIYNTLINWTQINFTDINHKTLLYQILSKSIKYHLNQNRLNFIHDYIKFNLNQLQNPSFLIIIQSILQRYIQNPTLLNLQLIKLMQEQFLYILIHSNHSIAYKNLQKMVNILLSFYHNFKSNLSKELIQFLKNDPNLTNNKYLYGLIMSIIAVYTPQAQLNGIHRGLYSDESQYQFYHKIIGDFCNINHPHIFQEFINNPENVQGLKLILLMIKTTIINNYQVIFSQGIQLEFQLMNTIIKMILLNIYGGQCLEIFDELVKKIEGQIIGRQRSMPLGGPKYKIIFILKKFKDILEQMSPYIINNIYNHNKIDQSLFKNIYHIISSLKNTFYLSESNDTNNQSESLESFDQFQACLQLILKIPQEYHDREFYRSSTKLLQLFLPKKRDVYNVNNLIERYPFLRDFVKYMIKTQNTNIFQLYLKMINNSIFTQNQFIRLQNQEITTIFLANHPKPYIFNILSFISQRKQYSHQAHNQIFHILYQNLLNFDFSYTFSIFNIFNHFKTSMPNHIYTNYLYTNVDSSLFILTKINTLLQESIFINQFQQLMMFKLKITMFFTQNLKEYCSIQYENLQDITMFIDQQCKNVNIDYNKKVTQRINPEYRSLWHKTILIELMLSAFINKNHQYNHQKSLNLINNINFIREEVVKNRNIDGFLIQNQKKYDVKMIKGYLNKIEKIYNDFMHQWEGEY